MALLCRQELLLRKCVEKYIRDFAPVVLLVSNEKQQSIQFLKKASDQLKAAPSSLTNTELIDAMCIIAQRCDVTWTQREEKGRELLNGLCFEIAQLEGYLTETVETVLSNPVEMEYLANQVSIGKRKYRLDTEDLTQTLATSEKERIEQTEQLIEINRNLSERIKVMGTEMDQVVNKYEQEREESQILCRDKFIQYEEIILSLKKDLESLRESNSQLEEYREKAITQKSRVKRLTQEKEALVKKYETKLKQITAKHRRNKIQRQLVLDKNERLEVGFKEQGETINMSTTETSALVGRMKSLKNKTRDLEQQSREETERLNNLVTCLKEEISFRDQTLGSLLSSYQDDVHQGYVSIVREYALLQSQLEESITKYTLIQETSNKEMNIIRDELNAIKEAEQEKKSKFKTTLKNLKKELELVTFKYTQSVASGKMQAREIEAIKNDCQIEIETKLQQQQSILDQLEQTTTLLQSTTAQLQIQVSNNKHLQDDKDHLEAQLNQFQENKEELEIQVKQLKEINLQLDAQLFRFKEKGDRLETELSKLRDNKVQSDDELINLNNKYDVLKSECRQKINDLETELIQCRDENTQYNSELNECRQKINDLETELIQCRDQNTQYNSMFIEMNQRGLELETEVKELREEKLFRAAEIDKLENEKLQSELIQCRDQNTQYNSELNECRQKINELETELIRLRDENTQYNSMFIEMNQRGLELETEVKELREEKLFRAAEIDKLENEKLQIIETKNKVQSELGRIKDAKNKLETEIGHLKDKNVRLEAEIGKLIERGSQLEIELKENKIRLELELNVIKERGESTIQQLQEQYAKNLAHETKRVVEETLSSVSCQGMTEPEEIIKEYTKTGKRKLQEGNVAKARKLELSETEMVKKFTKALDVANSTIEDLKVELRKAKGHRSKAETLQSKLNDVNEQLRKCRADQQEEFNQLLKEKDNLKTTLTTCNIELELMKKQWYERLNLDSTILPLSGFNSIGQMYNLLLDLLDERNTKEQNKLNIEDMLNEYNEYIVRPIIHHGLTLRNIIEGIQKALDG